MKFTEITKNEFVIFLENHPLKTFFQSIEMDYIDKKENWECFYVGVKKNNKIIAATRMRARATRFNKKIFYAPRGLLVNYEDKKTLTFFTKNIKKFIKKQHGYALHIDPPLIHKERDINGNVVQKGIDNSNVITFLKKLGFKHCGFTKEHDHTREIRWSFVLPLTNKTENDILNDMSGNTRRAIQKAEHLKVNIKVLKKEELHLFKEIMEHTSERREFIDRDLNYYKDMYQQFAKTNQIKYLLAQVNLNDTLEVLNNDLEKLNKKRENVLASKKSSTLKELDSQIITLSNKINEIKKIKKEKGNNLNLACAMFMIYGNEVMYYHAGSIKEYMSFFGQYLIQWEMIKYAIKQKKEQYNFYGIKGVFDKKDKDYGVYLFKKGFNGHVVEYIGDFYLPTSSYYYVQKSLSKIKQIFKNILYKKKKA